MVMAIDLYTKVDDNLLYNGVCSQRMIYSGTASVGLPSYGLHPKSSSCEQSECEMRL